MDVKSGRMISLGYGKYWRSDAIVGLRPIEEDRGPGRRTEVYTATLDDPIVASRSERAILQDMAVATGEQFRMEEAREMLGDLLEALTDVPDVVRRLLLTEAHVDVPAWVRRLKSFLEEDASEPKEQNDLFS